MSINAVVRSSAPARRSLVALSAVGALGLGLLGAGAPATATPGAASAVPVAQAVAVAKKAPTVSTGLKWADGTAMRATVVTEKGAGKFSRGSLASRTLASTKGAAVLGVLADGRAVLLVKGKLSVVERNGKIRPYAKGKTPTHDAGFAEVKVQGNVVYVLEYSYPRDVPTQTLTVYKGTGAAVSGKTVFKENGPGWSLQWAVSKGRVYYSATQFNSKNDPVGVNVYSRALGGTQSKLEAKNAEEPVLVDGGVAVTTMVRDAQEPYGMRPTGAKLIGGRTLVKSGSATWDFFTGGDGSRAAFSGGGRVLTLNASLTGNATGIGARYLVIDFKAKKAWSVSTQGFVLDSPAASGSRATWGSIKIGELGELGTKIYSFDVRTGKLRVATTKNALAGLAANGKAIAWSTGKGSKASVAAGLLR